MSLLPAQKASGYVTFSGAVGTAIPSGFLVKTVAGYQYAVLVAGRIGADGTVILPVQAVGTGADYNADAGTVKEIVNPLDGVSSCTNASAMTGGRWRESDEEFRDRYYKSVDFAGGVNADAIAGEILQNVEGVYSAICYENDTDEVDALGLPPHSFEVVAYGGLDEEVAKAIFRRKAGGIQTYGGKTIPVVALNGQSYDIHFSRPATVPIYIKVYDLETDTNFPWDGESRIKAALISFIGGDVQGGLPIGTDVLYMALPGAILSVPGVVDFSLSIGTSAAALAVKNIVIGTREKAVTNADAITIVREAGA